MIHHDLAIYGMPFALCTFSFLDGVWKKARLSSGRFVVHLAMHSKLGGLNDLLLLGLSSINHFFFSSACSEINRRLLRSKDNYWGTASAVDQRSLQCRERSW